MILWFGRRCGHIFELVLLGALVVILLVCMQIYIMYRLKLVDDSRGIHDFCGSLVGVQYFTLLGNLVSRQSVYVYALMLMTQLSLVV